LKLLQNQQGQLRKAMQADKDTNKKPVKKALKGKNE
jgi:hypothetical protein